MDLSNEGDCLVRFYLGRKTERSRAKASKQRNFNQSGDETEHLRHRTKIIASAMVQDLTARLWTTDIDSNDVESMLASAPRVKSPATAAEFMATNRDDPRNRR